MDPILLPYSIALALSQSLTVLPPEPETTAKFNTLATGRLRSETVTFSAERLPKWTEVGTRFSMQGTIAPQRQAGAAGEWRGIVGQAQTIDRADLLDWANRRLNSIRYVPDLENWGRSDYWSTPIEFLERGGDCEDFAIAKYYLLNELGVPAKDMRIAISRRHAVLIVKDGGQEVVLDNLRNRPYRLKSSYMRKVLFTINNDDWVIRLG